MSSTPAIRIAGLSKSYGDLEVLRSVDIDVTRGGIFALLGSTGAGKTTVVKILSTLLSADGGTAVVNGFDVAAEAADVRESISPTGQNVHPITRGSRPKGASWKCRWVALATASAASSSPARRRDRSTGMRSSHVGRGGPSTGRSALPARRGHRTCVAGGCWSVEGDGGPPRPGPPGCAGPEPGGLGSAERVTSFVHGEVDLERDDQLREHRTFPAPGHPVADALRTRPGPP
jgi:ABC transporter